MAFFCKKWHKLTKICPFDPQNGSYFSENAKCSKSHTYFCCRHYRESVYQNQVNWGIFDGVITFSVEKAVPKSQCEKREKLLFFGQKSANFENFPKIFCNLIKLIEIHVWSEFQLIWSVFGHFMAILRPILGHFSLYIKYRNIAIFYQTYTHVCLHKSRTVDFSIPGVPPNLTFWSTKWVIFWWKCKIFKIQ